MKVVDEYIARLNEPQRLALAHVCQIIQQTAPGAEAVITYGMPGFKYKGKYLISFGTFKDHMSIFPGADAIEAHKESLNNFKISKGTIQFTGEHHLPDSLLVSIIEHRMRDIGA